MLVCRCIIAKYCMWRVLNIIYSAFVAGTKNPKLRARAAVRCWTAAAFVGFVRTNRLCDFAYRVIRSLSYFYIYSCGDVIKSIIPRCGFSMECAIRTKRVVYASLQQQHNFRNQFININIIAGLLNGVLLLGKIRVIIVRLWV